MTHVLVAYASQRDATAEIAERIGGTLREGGRSVDVRPADGVRDLHGYDAVVLGSAVDEGDWSREARRFTRRHRRDLIARPVWLFSSGPADATPLRRQAERITANGVATFDPTTQDQIRHWAESITAELADLTPGAL